MATYPDRSGVIDSYVEKLGHEIARCNGLESRIKTTVRGGVSKRPTRIGK